MPISNFVRALEMTDDRARLHDTRTVSLCLWSVFFFLRYANMNEYQCDQFSVLLLPLHCFRLLTEWLLFVYIPAFTYASYGDECGALFQFYS